VFLVNSRLSRFHDTNQQTVKSCRSVHHLPKLRSYFAEFLRYHYLNRLSIQCQPTSVGFRYGRIIIFLASRPHTKPVLVHQFAVSKMIVMKNIAHQLRLSSSSKRPRSNGQETLISLLNRGLWRQRWSAVIRYLYQHWRSCFGPPVSCKSDALYRLFHYKWKIFHFVISVRWLSSTTFLKFSI
jgi:hypothetical protein